MNFDGAKKYILNKLQKELDPRLTYHSVDHTMDVLDSSVRLAALEHLTENESIILQTAALFHDTGMLKTYKGHEYASAEIAAYYLPKFGYEPDDVNEVARMITTTQLPQSACNKLDMILCDADLDYLGRDDFFMISHQLKHEWDITGIYPTTLRQWYEIQVDFLTKHHYFTQSARDMREQKKLENLQQIIDMCKTEINSSGSKH